MPELIDSDKCQHTDVMESTVRPKIVLKIKKYTPKSYESYSDDYDKKEGSKKLELPKIVPKNSVAEKLKPNNITSTFTNEHGHGEGIGHKDIKTMKPCRKKVSLKTVKPLIKHESIIKKVIKPHHRSAARESLFTCSETSDSDDIPPKTKKINTNGQITKPLRHSSAADKSKVVFKKLRCKSLYEHLFGNDIDDIVTSSNNEECQNVHDEFKNMMNGKITSKIIHTDDVNINLVNKDGNNGRSSINDSNNNTVTEESNNNGSSNVDDDDSDVISLCADE